MSMDLLMARWQANADQQWSAAENDASASVTGPLSLFPGDQSDLLLSAEGVRLLEEEIARRQLEIDEPQQQPVYNTQQQQQQLVDLMGSQYQQQPASQYQQQPASQINDIPAFLPKKPPAGAKGRAKAPKAPSAAATDVPRFPAGESFYWTRIQRKHEKSNSIELYRTLSNQLYPPLAQRKRTVNGLDFSSSTEELARELEIRAGYLSKVMPTVASHLNEHK